jgi:hypothetical protein
MSYLNINPLDTFMQNLLFKGTQRIRVLGILNSRQKFVIFNNVTSAVKAVKRVEYGVPQGIILSLTFFLTFSLMT